MKKKHHKNRDISQGTIPAPDIKTKITDILDIPAAAVAGTTHMEISGNTEVMIDGCAGILAYDENIIRLAANGMVVGFTGRKLQVKVLTHNSAIIGGFITGIEFIT